MAALVELGSTFAPLHQQKALKLGEQIGRPRTARRAWTQVDDDRLVKLAAAGIMRCMAAELMHRNVGTIRSHARALGLDWDEPPRSALKVAKARGPAPRAWTTEDDRRLTELANARVPVGLAANELDRAYNTVRHHANVLGLKFERDRFARMRHRQIYGSGDELRPLA